MVEPVLISMPPERQNIFYRVSPKAELQPFVNSIVEQFLMEDFPKTVVFVRTYNDCSNIYLLLQQKLGDMLTNPHGYLNLADYGGVEMFTRVLTVDKRTQVLSSFSDSESPLKLIVSTSALGMGVDM